MHNGFTYHVICNDPKRPGDWLYFGGFNTRGEPILNQGTLHADKMNHRRAVDICQRLQMMYPNAGYRVDFA